MHPDGSGERILSESFDVEGPTFCPNGRVLMFLRESAGARQPGQRLSLAPGVDRHHRVQRYPQYYMPLADVVGGPRS